MDCIFFTNEQSKLVRVFYCFFIFTMSSGKLCSSDAHKLAYVFAVHFLV